MTRETRALEPAGAAAPAVTTQLRREGARSCVGCGGAEERQMVRGSSRHARRNQQLDGSARVLIRMIISPEGELAIDSGRAGRAGGFGRGAYVHADAVCLAAAAAKGLARSAKRPITLNGAPVTRTTLSATITEVYDRRFASMLGAARRAGAVEVGSNAVSAAWRGSRAHLLIVAVDAAAAADLSAVREAVADGRAVVWGNKEELARTVTIARRHGDESDSDASGAGVGVVAVTDTRFAHALQETRHVIESVCVVPRLDLSRGGKTSRQPRRRGHAEEARRDTDQAASILEGGTGNLREPVGSQGQALLSAQQQIAEHPLASQAVAARGSLGSTPPRPSRGRRGVKSA